MRHWADEVNTVEEFLDKYKKHDRFRGRGEEYADLQIRTYSAQDRKKGYCYITHHDSITGREVYFKSNKMLVLCDGCELPFVAEHEYADRCTPHEEDCQNYGQDDHLVDCDCDLNYHPYCCPECSEKRMK